MQTNNVQESLRSIWDCNTGDSGSPHAKKLDQLNTVFEQSFWRMAFIYDGVPVKDYQDGCILGLLYFRSTKQVLRYSIELKYPYKGDSQDGLVALPTSFIRRLITY